MNIDLLENVFNMQKKAIIIRVKKANTQFRQETNSLDILFWIYFIISFFFHVRFWQSSLHWTMSVETNSNRNVSEERLTVDDAILDIECQPFPQNKLFFILGVCCIEKKIHVWNTFWLELILEANHLSCFNPHARYIRRNHSCHAYNAKFMQASVDFSFKYFQLLEGRIFKIKTITSYLS